MDDRLTDDDSSRVKAMQGLPGRETPQVLKRPIRQGAPWLVVLLLALACAWLAWEKWGPDDAGDIVGTSLIAFEKQNELTVFSSRFDVVAESTSTPSIGPFDVEALESRQAMIVPATVEYRLDLSQISREDFAWDADTQELAITLPAISVSRPNLDEAEARYFTDGLYVSRDTSVSLSRNNSAQAEERAEDFARNPEVMELARNAARVAVQQNLAIPLQVAGFENVAVNVRFEDE